MPDAQMASERDYSHRTAVQKLGVKPDQRIEVTGDVGSGLRRDVKEAIGRGLVKSGELDGAGRGHVRDLPRTGRLSRARSTGILQTRVTVCLRLEYVKDHVRRFSNADDDLVRRPGPAGAASVVHL